MGIACVPHLPQKIFSHFLCEGLCHIMSLGLGLSLKIFKSRSLSQSHHESGSKSRSRYESASEVRPEDKP